MPNWEGEAVPEEESDGEVETSDAVSDASETPDTIMKPDPTWSGE